MKLFVKWVIIVVAIAIAARLLPGISYQGEGTTSGTSVELVTLITMAAVFGLINLLVRPILLILTLPVTIITLGLFAFVLNAALLLLANWTTTRLFGVGLVIDGFLTALVAALIISIVTTVLDFFLMRD